MFTWPQHWQILENLLFVDTYVYILGNSFIRRAWRLELSKGKKNIKKQRKRERDSKNNKDTVCVCDFACLLDLFSSKLRKKKRKYSIHSPKALIFTETEYTVILIQKERKILTASASFLSNRFNQRKKWGSKQKRERERKDAYRCRVCQAKCVFRLAGNI